MRTDSNVTHGAYPSWREYLPDYEINSGSYQVRFARNQEDLDRVLRMRYEVFNLEMQEGLASSHATGRDSDEYDDGCHHLMVIAKETQAVVGTYRMQTHDMAQAHHGFYSQTEFDLSLFDEAFLHLAVELGRACVVKEHRNGRVLYHLWRGVCHYLLDNNRRYFFGCCSLNSQDPHDAKQLSEVLRQNGHYHAELLIQPQPGFGCPDVTARDTASGRLVTIPTLMQLYLNHGVKICSNPAIDRIFKTIDYLAIFDMENAPPHTKKMFAR